MKKPFLIIILSFGFIFILVSPVFAQGMMGNMMSGNNTIAQNDDGHTAREEAEGKEVWEKLQAKELNCEDLSDDDFGVLGEYFMGQMAGDSHEAMNDMITQMMGGEEGEEQVHIAMGKRMSGCEPNSPMPQSINDGMMPMMMNMMMGGGSNSMMGNFATNPTGWFGWVFMILFWIFVILAIVALIRWILNQSKREAKSKPALDILKERYAKGEIDKREFEEKRKDLD